MSNNDEELEGIANSIEGDLNKISKLKNFSIVGMCLSFSVILYLPIQYPGQQNPPLPITISVMSILIISYFGLINGTNRQNKIFKNMREKIFFYLFYSWKYHNDEKSKKYLKKCADGLSADLDTYKELAYTEDIYSTFDALRDTLIYNIYPKLGVRGAFGKHSDLTEQTSAWNEFKSISIDFYQNIPITLINERISTLNNFFERDETITLDNENELIKTVRVFTNWNIEMYKNSLSYRVLFYLILTGIIDYLLLSNNMVSVDVVIMASISIVIMAPYYLAPKSK